MLCQRPYTPSHGRGVFGCGDCMACRINHRRTWTHRIMLESYLHAESTFLTLTYNDENLPSDYSLDPTHPRNWIKRLRKTIAPRKLRYYLVGEYGDESGRPHYHAALFGIGLSDAELVNETWGMGHTMLAELNRKSAQYICGYVTKKMTKEDDPRLEGRYPEFARMSNRPGIAAGAIQQLAETLRTEHGIDYIEDNQDVPLSLAHGKKQLPLGRYLIKKLRTEMNIHDEHGEVGKIPSQKASEASEELRTLYENSTHYQEGKSFKEFLLALNKQKHRQLEAREKLYKKRITL